MNLHNVRVTMNAVKRGCTQTKRTNYQTDPQRTGSSEAGLAFTSVRCRTWKTNGLKRVKLQLYPVRRCNSKTCKALIFFEWSQWQICSNFPCSPACQCFRQRRLRDALYTLCKLSSSAAAKHQHSKPAIPELVVFALTGAIDINMQTVILLVTLWIFYIS